MSSTTNLQNLLVNVFRPIYVYDPISNLYTPKLQLSNIDTITANALNVGIFGIGDSNSNVFVGSNAGTGARNSSNNIAVGFNAGNSMAFVSNSVYLGFNAGAGVTGFSTSPVTDVIAIGCNTSGRGVSNIYIGSGTAVDSAITSTGNIFIGHGILVGDVSSRLLIGNGSRITIAGDLSNGWVGIGGRTTPSYAGNMLDVCGNTSITQLGLGGAIPNIPLNVSGTAVFKDGSYTTTINAVNTGIRVNGGAYPKVSVQDPGATHPTFLFQDVSSGTMGIRSSESTLAMGLYGSRRIDISTSGSNIQLSTGGVLRATFDSSGLIVFGDISVTGGISTSSSLGNGRYGGVLLSDSNVTTSTGSNFIGGVVLNASNISNVGNVNLSGSIVGSSANTSNVIGGITLSNSNINYGGTITGSTSNTSNVIGGVTLSNNNISYSGTITGSTSNTSNVIGGITLSNNNINYSGTITGSTSNTSNVIGGVTLSNGNIRYNGNLIGASGSILNTTDNFTVAGGSGTNTLAYSVDAINWTAASASGIFTTSVFGIAWNGSLWVAVGQGTNSIATSPDGINWTGRGTSVFSVGNGVAWNGSLWVAVGSGPNHTIATSPDGINWTGRGISIFSTVGNGVAWNGSLWVAVGSGTHSIATSPDGITWTGRGTSIFSTGGFGVAWNGSLWVAVGFGTHSIATSPDGITWTGRGLGPFDLAGLGVAWNGSLWVAVGQGSHSIAYSSDGTSWTGVTGTTIFSTFGSSVAWNGTVWVAIGIGSQHTIATSTDGISWTGRGISTFSSQGRGVATRRALPFVGNSQTIPTTIRAQNGSSNVPSYTFLNDASTGLHLIGTSQLAFDTSGIQRMVISNSNVGIGRIPGTTLDVSGPIRASDSVVGFNIQANPGQATSPAFVSSNDISTGMWFPGASQVAFSTAGVQRAVLDNTGKLSIGRAGIVSATDLLDISGNIRISQPNSAFFGPFFTTTSGSATFPSFTGTAGSGNNGDGMWFPAASNVAFSTAATERMRILSNGRVGIGTSAPSQALDVSGNIAYNGTITGSTSNTNNVIGGVTLSNNNINYSGTITGTTNNTSNRIGGVVLSNANVRVDGASASAPSYAFNPDASSGIFLNTIGNFGFSTGGIQRMVISNDRVGIGKSPTSGALDVSGPIFSSDTVVGFNVRTNNGTAANPSFISSTLNDGMWFPGASQVAFSTTGVERMRISNANVGIGTSTPNYTLDVNGSLAANATEQTLYLTSSSNVTTPVGFSNAHITLVGGGGGGGAGSTLGGGGGGGGAGTIVTQIVTSLTGGSSTLNFTRGNGGASAANGSNSTLAVGTFTIIAPGGTAGSSTVNINGGNGGAGHFGGGGGGGSINGTRGGGATVSTTGACILFGSDGVNGGASLGGNGGTGGGSSGGDGTASGSWGGGGGGGGSLGGRGGTGNGGAGTNGGIGCGGGGGGGGNPAPAGGSGGNGYCIIKFLR